MPQKDQIDATGALALISMSALFGFNQVVIQLVNAGLQPVFFAGLRSAGAILCLALLFLLRGRALGLRRADLPAGILIGALFAGEFILIFTALDLTTVSRASVLFYTMPLWLAFLAHFLIPGERITRLKAAGQVLAFAGVAIAIFWRTSAGEASLVGDVMALMAAVAWAGIAVVAKTGLRGVAPDRQLLWQVTVSAPLLFLAAPLFGPLIRDLQPIHLWGLAFQIVVVVTLGFALWFWLLTIYPAASVAAFSSLSPIFGVPFGWWLLEEKVTLAILLALALVTAGLVLINRPVQVPQKV